VPEKGACARAGAKNNKARSHARNLAEKVHIKNNGSPFGAIQGVFWEMRPVAYARGSVTLAKLPRPEITATGTPPTGISRDRQLVTLVCIVKNSYLETDGRGSDNRLDTAPGILQN